MRQVHCVSEDLCKQHKDFCTLKKYRKTCEKKFMAGSTMQKYSLNGKEGLSVRLSLMQHHWPYDCFSIFLVQPRNLLHLGISKTLEAFIIAYLSLSDADMPRADSSEQVRKVGA